MLSTLLYMGAQAQESGFTHRFLELRQPADEDDDLLQLEFDRKEIRELVADFESKEHTEEEWREYRQGKQLFEKAKQVNLVVDMEATLSSVQINGLLEPYEELFSMQADETRMLVAGMMKNNKVKELVALMDDPEGEMLLFFSVLFKKPVTLEKYMKSPDGNMQLVRFNAPDKEDDAFIKMENTGDEVSFGNTLFRFQITKTRTP